MMNVYFRILNRSNVIKRAVAALGYTFGSWFLHQKVHNGYVLMWLTLISFIMYFFSGLLYSCSEELKKRGEKVWLRRMVDMLSVLFMALGVFGYRIWT